MIQSDELYQDIILEHARRPRNAVALKGGSVLSTHEHNTLCGDDVRLFVEVQDVGPAARILRAAAVAQGCALSVASGSLLTEVLQGKTREEAHALVEQMLVAATGPSDESSGTAASQTVVVHAMPDDLQALGSIAHYPTRVKCVTMAWHAAKKLLDSRSMAEGERNQGRVGQP